MTRTRRPEVSFRAAATVLKVITLRIGADLVQEAEGRRRKWDVQAIRGVMDQRTFHGRLFASEGSGRYRRRRPEDEAA